MASVTLPPDQSLRISTLGDRYLLLSVADKGLLVGKGTPYTQFNKFSHGTYIFTEGLGFTSSIYSPYGLTVTANTIATPSSIEISTTGLRGADQGGTVGAALAGKNAGSLNFYVQHGTDENARHITYIAKGGDGGDTIVYGGQGGNGGNGGHVVRIFVSWYSKLFSAFAAFLARDDIVTGDLTKTVTKTDSVYTAALDLSRSPTSDMPSIDGPMSTLRATVAAIGNGGSYTLRQLAVDARRVRNALVVGTDAENSSSFASAINVSGGVPGSGKHVVGNTGAPGNPGTDTPLLLPQHDASFLPRDDLAALRRSTFAFAHPEQCAMLLTRANLYYYMGSPLLRSQAAQLYRRIIDRLAFLPDLTPNDPLYQAYSKSVIMPGDSLRKLARISEEASQQLTHIANGIDFNGFSATSVPRASYTFYKDAMDGALDDLVAFENAYIAYHAALTQQNELQDAVGSALRQTDSIIKRLNNDFDDLVKCLHKVDSQITLLSQPVLDAHSDLITEYKKLEDRIRNTFNLSVPQLINALNSCAFAPNKFMGSLQFMNMVWTGFNEVPNLGGIGVNKDVLIGKLTQGEATVKGITDTLSKSKLDGTFQLNDPLGARLMALEDEMVHFLSEYATTSFKDVIDEIKEKFDAYVKAVVERNKEIVLYNAILKLLVQKDADKKDYKKKRDELQGRIITVNDPNLPEITAYMDNIYQSARARVMKLLNVFIRSLNFRMLEEYDIYTIAFYNDDVDSVPLTMTSNVLRSARSRVEDKFGEAIERWGSEPAKFPQDFSSARGKRVKLESYQLTLLKGDAHAADVEIATVTKESKKTSDFSGCCNVRVYKVRFVFDGLKLKNHVKTGRVTVRMTHSGNDSIVDEKNLVHTYSHDAVKVVYSFDLHANGSMDILDDGNIAEADVNNQATSYAAPGPFTKWHVDLTSSEISHLDFTGVKAAYFDFCGTNYAL